MSGLNLKGQQWHNLLTSECKHYELKGTDSIRHQDGKKSTNLNELKWKNNWRIIEGIKRGHE